jgi:hypothetical protein
VTFVLTAGSRNSSAIKAIVLTFFAAIAGRVATLEVTTA